MVPRNNVMNVHNNLGGGLQVYNVIYLIFLDLLTSIILSVSSFHWPSSVQKSNKCRNREIHVATPRGKVWLKVPPPP